MQIKQSIFGVIKNSDIYKNTRYLIPINKFDPFSEKSLVMELIRLGFSPKKIPRDITRTPDYEIGNGYVVECTNYHGYFQESRIEETLKLLEEPGFEYYTQSDYQNNKIILSKKKRFKRKISNGSTIVRYKSDEWTHINKIIRKIDDKYGQCHDYEKRIINLNFINEPFNPETIYQVIDSILEKFGANYENLNGIMVGMRIPPFSQRLSYFIVKKKGSLLPKKFKKISRVPRSEYKVIPVDYFFRFGKHSHISLCPPHIY